MKHSPRNPAIINITQKKDADALRVKAVFQPAKFPRIIYVMIPNISMAVNRCTAIKWLAVLKAMKISEKDRGFRVYLQPSSIIFNHFFHHIQPLLLHCE